MTLTPEQIKRDEARDFGAWVGDTVNGLKNSESLHIGVLPWD